MFLPPQNALRRRAFKEGHFTRQNSIVGGGDDLGEVMGERREGTGATASTTASTTAAEERQQGQDDGTNLGGDYNGVIIKYQKYIMK